MTNDNGPRNDLKSSTRRQNGGVTAICPRLPLGYIHHQHFQQRFFGVGCIDLAGDVVTSSGALLLAEVSQRQDSVALFLVQHHGIEVGTRREGFARALDFMKVVEASK